jgi:hypothetical protein
VQLDAAALARLIETAYADIQLRLAAPSPQTPFRN